MNDLRLPIGFFFSLVGLILLGVGVVAPAHQAPLTSANVNLYCGAIMLVFGVVMLWLGRKSF